MYSEGSISWLPPKQDLPHEHALATEALDDGCFNHPVLILATDYTRHEAIILIVSLLTSIPFASIYMNVDHVVWRQRPSRETPKVYESPLALRSNLP